MQRMLAGTIGLMSAVDNLSSQVLTICGLFLNAA